MLERKGSSVSKHSPSKSERYIGAKMDTGGLIQELSEFLLLSSPNVPGELCKKHCNNYSNAVNDAVTWAVKGK
jgi:hypothetical protein